MKRFPSKRLPVLLLVLWLVFFTGIPHVARTVAVGTNPPTIQGWGGSRLMENENYTGPAIASIVFPGENASDQELLARVLVERGLNAMRVSFAPQCTNPNGFLGPYDSNRLDRAIRIAKTLGLWIIVDYHGYADVFNTTSVNGVTVQQCWLNFWSGITSQFKNAYSHLIWEPENEPAYCPNHAGTNLSQGCFFNNATAAMPTLNSEYQAFITQSRNQGDSHWIVVQNICSYGCNLCPTGNADCSAAISGYPSVTDPLNRVFISLHPYMSYHVYHNMWDNATADSVAAGFYDTMSNGSQTTGFPVLDTEGGPGPIQANINGTMVRCADLVLQGSSGFCKTNLRFIQTLTSLLENRTPQMINWLWWTVGDWSSTPDARNLGALAQSGWGNLITWQKVVTHLLSLDRRGDGTIFPAPGNYSFIDGTVVNVTATPATGNMLSSWQLGDRQLANANPLQLPMNNDQIAIAVFENANLWRTIVSTISENSLFIIFSAFLVLGTTLVVLIRRGFLFGMKSLRKRPSRSNPSVKKAQC